MKGDDLDVLRALYKYLRNHPSVIVRGQAYWLWQRLHGRRPTSFMAGDGGRFSPETIRFDRTALIAELRLLVLAAGAPASFLAHFDRSDN